MRFLLDGAFLLADLAAVRLMRSVWESADADLFQLFLYSAFLAYGFAVRAGCRVKAVQEGWQQLDTAHHDRLALFRILHMLFLIALPIALFYANMESGARGDEWLLTISFLLLPALTIFTVVQAAHEPSPSARGTDRLFLAVRIAFLYAFVSFNTISLQAGDLLALTLGRELFGPGTTQTAWFLVLPVRLFFVVFFFLPMRLWLAMPALARKERGALWGPLAAALLILANGILESLA
jgi:hypothetical protein